MFRIIAISLLLLPLTSCAQLNPQSKKVTEKFFPDFDAEINTPAFNKKKGFTSYSEMMEYLNKLVSEHPDIASLSMIGQSQEGKEIPMIVLDNKTSTENKTRVFMQGGLHGNEPASTESMLYLINQILNDAECKSLLDKVVLGIIPMANIDGYEKQDRYAANGLDLNRDQTKLMAQETSALKKAFNSFDAEVAIDFHEYRPYRNDFAKMGTFGITGIYDVMFLYSGNLNVPKQLRNYTKDVFVDPAKKRMDEKGLRNHDYFSTRDHEGHTHFHQGSSNARSSATSFALRNTISTLIEVRGVGLNRTSFTRRVMTGYLVALSYLESAAKNGPEIKQILAQANLETNDAVVKSKSEISDAQIQVIDLDTNEEITLDVILHDAWHSSAVLTRSRAPGYIILAEQTELIEKLKTLGFEMNELESVRAFDIENYLITEYSEDSEKYEGTNRQYVQTEINKSSKEFPAGSQVLLMSQPRSNLAIELLEPEASNSFVSFGLLKVETGAELPIYRLQSDFIPDKP